MRSAVQRTGLFIVAGLVASSISMRAMSQEQVQPRVSLGSRQPLENPMLRGGDYTRYLEYDGLIRKVIVHVPPHVGQMTALPVVFMLHPGAGSASQAQKCYGWDSVADREGFIVVYPQGTGGKASWDAVHCCWSAFERSVDDVGFIRETLHQLEVATPIDRSRVYAAGMSNGGMLTHRLASEMSDEFAAVAVVAGTIGGQTSASEPIRQIAPPPRSVPIIMFHGEMDANVNFYGGPSHGVYPTTRIDLSQADCIDFWVAANECDPQAPQYWVSDTGDVIRASYSPMSASGADVVHYAIVNQGHAWPGGCPSNGLKGDPPTKEISATELSWAFFKAHPMR